VLLIVETVSGIHPPKAKPVLVSVPAVGKVSVCPNRYTSLDFAPSIVPEVAPLVL